MKFRNVMALSVVGACAAGLVFAQEQPQPAKTVQVVQKDKAEKSEAKKPSARMPNYFPKLGLSDQQREKILNALIDYNEQIDDLEDQINDLRAKRDADVRAVLSPEQREKLASLELEARKKRAEKADKGKKPAEPTEESK